MAEQNQNHNIEPKLDKPGAGIPFLERMILRFYYAPFVAGKSEWKDSRIRFDKLATKVSKVIEGLSDEQLSKKVLVPPQKGLEDSSRYWSIAMVLEHIVIVSQGIERILEGLTSGKKLNLVFSIADVKPPGKVSAQESLKMFQQLKDNLLNDLDRKMKDLESPMKQYHPWMGMLNARQWYWLLGVHVGIHLKQIIEIKKHL